MQSSKLKVLFEPWSLGDAVIAAAALAMRPQEYVLACHPRWHELLHGILPREATLLAVELSYTTRDKKTEAKTLSSYTDVTEVYSIRGDIRDYRAAQKMFPSANIHMSGWLPFIARRLTLCDLPFRLGLVPISNRYQAWVKILGLSTEELQKNYTERRQKWRPKEMVLIHVGAQWKSKQFPEVFALKTQLHEKGLRNIRILAGPQDPLPQGLQENDVQRPLGQDLLQTLSQARFLIANDSGPMHLAAAMGVPVLALARTSNIAEWIPPLAAYLASSQMPQGYQPCAGYTSDENLGDWPTPESITHFLLQAGRKN